MTLPSQSMRSASHRSAVFRGKNQVRSSRLALLLAFVIVLTTWRLLGHSAQPALQAAAASEDPEVQLVAQPSAIEAGLSQLAEIDPRAGQGLETDWLGDIELPAATQAPAIQRTHEPAFVAPTAAQAYDESLALGFGQLHAGDILAARRTLSRLYLSDAMPPAEAERVRRALTQLGERWILGPEILKGDPYCSTHKIGKGDLLSRLPKSQDLDLDWRFLQRINAISDPARIRLGQALKLVHGSFHARVSKSEYRLDLFLGDLDERILVASFPVGHGESGSTPEGLFRVRKDSKLINPAWTNPRTNEQVAADDPENPIGEHWIGLEGVSEAVRDVQQIGIHGTTDLASIGQMRSMGCVRMQPPDVALLYEVLVHPASSILVRP